jgi:hypothetical protein
VVVDDIEDHAQLLAVRGLDEACEPFRSAVGAVRRVAVDAVVAPTAVAGERRDGHQLDRRRAQLTELGQVGDHAVECAFGREGADVQLVDDELFEREAAPGRRRQLDDSRRAPQPVRLRARARIGQRLPSVEDVQVVLAGTRT